MTTKPLVIGNWKMNGNRALCETMVNALTAQPTLVDQVNVGIAPPFTLLPVLADAMATTPLWLGAQTVSQHDGGAHTGEVSATLLNEFDTQFILLGHSERRQFYGETDAVVAAKLKAAVAQQLTVVLCVGETEVQRDQQQTTAVIAAQLDAALRDAPPAVWQQLVIAYEPVWAIGTGLTATPAQAQEVHQFIRTYLQNELKTDAKAISLLYGGSVKPDNAASLFSEADIDGGLIGGASLQVDDFIAICQAANA